MTQIVADAAMAKRIATDQEAVPVVDESGAVIGVCTPVNFPHSPYTREEIELAREEARNHPDLCKTTAEVLSYLYQLPAEQP